MPDGSQSIRGSGTHKGRVLGLEVILGPTWQAGSLGKDGATGDLSRRRHLSLDRFS